jgi:hypothetical protein
MTSAVWVKLVIDGDDSYRYEASRIKITSETNFVDDLKDAVAIKYQFAMTALSIDAASLKVYPPGTNPVPAEGAESLRPGLLLSSSDFPSDTTDQTPLIVTAESMQQVSLVSRCCCSCCSIFSFQTAVLLNKILSL